MMTDGRTIEVDIMTLFKQIDHKLDSMVTMIALKADSGSVLLLQEKVLYLEINGSNNARAALADVKILKDQIGHLGWQVAFAFGSAILAAVGTLIMGLMKFGK